MQYPSRHSVMFGAIVAALALLGGCTGRNSVSSYARTGDTVLVAFGAESEAPYLRKEDLKAELTDAVQKTVPVKIRELFNLYPDPTSRVGSEKASPYDYLGLRSAVIDLIDPGTGAKPALATGKAKLALKRVSNGQIVASNIEIEILAGTGASNPLTDQSGSQSYVPALSARPQVRYWVRPVANTYNQPLGAVEFELRFPQSALAGRAETSWPQAIQTAADQHVRFSTRYYQEGSNEVIKVLMVNPDGIVNADLTKADGTADRPLTEQLMYRGMSYYSTLRFAVVWGDARLATTYPAETFDRSVILNGTTVLRVFDTAGADVSANFQLVKE